LSESITTVRGPAVFWLGAFAVSAGVILHLPMFFEAAPMHYRMAGMPMGMPMLVGMALIGVGTIAAGFGLLPARAKSGALLPASDETPLPENTGGMTRAHWRLLVVLSLALIIDTMKPVTLGFVIPGTAAEYGLPRTMVALLPFSGLTGTALGSYLWGILADRLGRRSAILLAAIMFIGTSICGAMPSFNGNLVMCFFMGLAAGGMLPITYTLLAETIPTAYRGWSLVLLGGLGLVGGYFAASGCAWLLEPHFGWRILWLLGLPTGFLLVLFNRFIPESPRFLILHGRRAEAREIMDRFRMPAPAGYAEVSLPAACISRAGISLFRAPLAIRTAALNLTALAWGLVNFGILLWLPADLRARGFSVAGSDSLLFQSSLIALPITALAAWLYSRWSTKWTLTAAIALTGFGLLFLPLLGSPSLHVGPVFCFAILMTGANAMIAVLLPYSAENYPLSLRGRGTGLVAAISKSGGIIAQLAAMAALVPGLSLASLILAVPVAGAALLVALAGAETRGLDLEQMDHHKPRAGF
jgi:MFS transporter, putative metabolite:H+ symporter